MAKNERRGKGWEQKENKRRNRQERSTRTWTDPRGQVREQRAQLGVKPGHVAAARALVLHRRRQMLRGHRRRHRRRPCRRGLGFGGQRQSQLATLGHGDRSAAAARCEVLALRCTLPPRYDGRGLSNQNKVPALAAAAGGSWREGCADARGNGEVSAFCWWCRLRKELEMFPRCLEDRG